MEHQFRARSDAVETGRPRSLTGAGRALYCDEYELTMAQSFLHHGQTGRAVFELFVRHLPPHRGYLVAAGLEQALAYLGDLRFQPEDLEYLRRTGTYSPDFLDHLSRLRFSGDVDALPEGTVIGAGAPLLRVNAPRIEATIVESALLAIVNHQTMVATKVARIVEAAAGRPVWDFSLRRLHGPDAAVAVARAAYIGGAAGTATVVAGRLLGIPTTGTMAHHYVLAFGPDGEQAAFEQFLRDFPARAALLVDTYDTRRGVERAVAASQATGIPLAAIRLDSGDLASLSRQARRILDDAGMGATRIIASGDLDEYRIAALVAADAPIDAFGVGTMLGVSADAPYLGGVYKLVAQEVGGRMIPVMKRSVDKETDPGVHQLVRTSTGDVLCLEDEEVDGRRLLQPATRGGRVCDGVEPLDRIRERARAERQALPPEVRRLDAPEPLTVRRSPGLVALRRALAEGAVSSGGIRP